MKQRTVLALSVTSLLLVASVAESQDKLPFFSKEAREQRQLNRKLKRQAKEQKKAGNREQPPTIEKSTPVTNKTLHAPKVQKGNEAQRASGEELIQPTKFDVSDAELLEVRSQECADVPTNIRNLVTKHMLLRKTHVPNLDEATLVQESSKMMGLLFYRSFHNAAEGFVNVWDKSNVATKVTHDHRYSDSSLAKKVPFSRLSRVGDIELSATPKLSASKTFGLGGMTVDRFLIGGHGKDNFQLLKGYVTEAPNKAWDSCMAEDVFGSRDKREWMSKFSQSSKLLESTLQSQTTLASGLKNSDPRSASMVQALGAILALCPQFNLGVMGREIAYSPENPRYFGGAAETSDWSKAKAVCAQELSSTLSLAENLDASDLESKGPLKKVGAGLKSFLQRITHKDKVGESAQSSDSTISMVGQKAPTTEVPPSSPTKASEMSSPELPVPTAPAVPAITVRSSSGFRLSSKAASGLPSEKIAEIEGVFADVEALKTKIDSPDYYSSLGQMSEEQQEQEYLQFQAQFQDLKKRLGSARSGVDFKIHKTADSEIGIAEKYVDLAIKGFEDAKVE